MTLDVIILLSLSLRLCFILSKTSINHKCVYTSQISISLDMILIRTPNIDEAHEFIHYAAVNETYKRHNNNQHNIPRYNNIMCELPREKKISAISVQITLYVYIMSTARYTVPDVFTFATPLNVAVRTHNPRSTYLELPFKAGTFGELELCEIYAM